MSKPWRNFAFLIFIGTFLFGGLAGHKLQAASDEGQDELRLYTELLQAVHEGYGQDVEYKDLVYASIRGMLRSLDPHTNFLSPEDYQQMRERQAASFYGLGILVSKRNGELTVISPIEGTPAWRMGLRAGDVISTIEGESTDIMSLDEAVTKLKGPKGTQVHVGITRRGLDEPLMLDITRAEIPQNTVRYAYMMNETTGYIRLTDFSRSTALFERANVHLVGGVNSRVRAFRGVGGSLDEIMQTIRYGVRNDNPNSHYSQMPAFGADGILGEAEIDDVAEYVVMLSGGEANGAMVQRGAVTFDQQCAACHGTDGSGMRDFGAPDLTDREWLYGGDRETIRATITNSRFGVMPAWEDRLDPATVRALAIWVHERGGGEE